MRILIKDALLLYLLLINYWQQSSAENDGRRNPWRRWDNPGKISDPQTECTVKLKMAFISCEGVPNSLLRAAISNSAKRLAITSKDDGDETKESVQPELQLVDCSVTELNRDLIDAVGTVSLKALIITKSGLHNVTSDAFLSYKATLKRLAINDNFLTKIPEAVKQLVGIEVLDLRQNYINSLPAASFFHGLDHLRELLLSHNQLGQLTSTQDDLGIKSSGLSLEVFNIEPLRDSLIKLSLDSNNLTKFPQQFNRKFDRLTNLDLSHNQITSVPSEAFSAMTRLVEVDLSQNNLSTYTPKTFPRSLRRLHLSENPWRCDCNVEWIQRALGMLPPGRLAPRSASEISLMGVVKPTDVVMDHPTCTTPLHLTGVEISDTTGRDTCNADGLSLQRVMFLGEGPQASPVLQEALSYLHFMNATSLSHFGLLVAWRVEKEFYGLSEKIGENLSWAVTMRKSSESAKSARPTTMKLERYQKEQADWEPTEAIYTEVLHGLESDTDYVVCLTPVSDGRYYTRPDHCKSAQTQPKSNGIISSPGISSGFSNQQFETSLGQREGPLVINRPDYIVQTDKISILKGTRSLTLSWNITTIPKREEAPIPLLGPLGWRITYRKIGTPTETEVIILSKGGDPISNFTNHYLLEDLEPSTGYLLCFQVLGQDDVNAALIQQTLAKSINSTQGRKIPFGNDQQILYDKSKDTTTTTTIEPISKTTTTTEQPEYDYDYTFTNDDDYNSPTTTFSSPPVFPGGPEVNGPFVYTSTGEKIRISGGPSSLPLPPVYGSNTQFTVNNGDAFDSSRPPNPFQGGNTQGISSQFAGSSIDLPPGFTNGGQTIGHKDLTYNTDETLSGIQRPLSENQHNGRQLRTYVETRKRKRSVDEINRLRRDVRRDSETTFSESNDDGTIRHCEEIVTLAENVLVTPVAVATTVSTSTTVLVVILICCCCPNFCKRNKKENKTKNKVRKNSTMSANSYFYDRKVSITSEGIKNELTSDDSISVVAGRRNSTANRKERTISICSAASGYVTPVEQPSDLRLFNPNRDSLTYIAETQVQLSRQGQDKQLSPNANTKTAPYHPGYDVPPTTPTALGYDYPSSTPVNPINSPSRRLKLSSPPTPSPSSSDSNYNAAVEESLKRNQLQLNIPFGRASSDVGTRNATTKSDNRLSDIDSSSIPRTYVRNANGNKRHKKFLSPQRSIDSRSDNMSCEYNPDQVNGQSTGKGIYNQGFVDDEEDSGKSSMRHSAPDLVALMAAERDHQDSSLDTYASAYDPSQENREFFDLPATERLNSLINSGTRSLPRSSLNRKRVRMGISTSPVSLESASPFHKLERSISETTGDKSTMQIAPELPRKQFPKPKEDRHGYVNDPFSKNKKEAMSPTSTEAAPYHVWSSNRGLTVRWKDDDDEERNRADNTEIGDKIDSRPQPVGDIVLTGGTLIEVPDGYVVPGPPRPTLRGGRRKPRNHSGDRKDDEFYKYKRVLKDKPKPPRKPTEYEKPKQIPKTQIIPEIQEIKENSKLKKRNSLENSLNNNNNTNLPNKVLSPNQSADEDMNANNKPFKVGAKYNKTKLTENVDEEDVASTDSEDEKKSSILVIAPETDPNKITIIMT